MSLSKVAKPYLTYQSKYQNLNAFITRLNESAPSTLPIESAPNHSTGKLDGKLFAIKDNICTANLKTTAGSNILKDFNSPYDATVVTLLRQAGAIITGKTNLDEFGMGSHSTNSHFGPSKQEFRDGEAHSVGGSSGGSALAVASSQCWAALGTDTGGSVRLPAAYCGVVGFKPSYGRLSRWGVIAYANSLDTVGIMGKDVHDVQSIYKVLNIADQKDPTSLSASSRLRLGSGTKNPKLPFRIGIPLDYNIATLHPTVRRAWIDALKALSAQGHILHTVRLLSTQYALSAYYILAPAEASSNLAKYDGVRYGSRSDDMDGTIGSTLFSQTRGQGLGAEVQRRILLGAFSLSAEAMNNYFIQAQKVRRLVQQDFNRVFLQPNLLLDDEANEEEDDNRVDVLLCPTAPSLAPPLSEVLKENPIQSYMNDVFTVPASIAGLPAISLPVPISRDHDEHTSRPGIQIIGQYGTDHLVLQVAGQLQKILKHRESTPHFGMSDMDKHVLREATPRQKRLCIQRSRQLGISIKEAFQTVEAEKESAIAKSLAELEEARGVERIDEAAKLLGLSREAYAAQFVDQKHVVSTEAVFFANLKRDRECRAAADAADTTIPSVADVTAMLRRARSKTHIWFAGQKMLGETLIKYASRFMYEKDPVEAERKFFDMVKARRMKWEEDRHRERHSLKVDSEDSGVNNNAVEETPVAQVVAIDVDDDIAHLNEAVNWTKVLDIWRTDRTKLGRKTWQEWEEDLRKREEEEDKL